MESNIKEILKKHIVTTQFLGQGSYSRVYLGHETEDTSKKLAFKVVPCVKMETEKGLMDKIKSELKIL